MKSFYQNISYLLITFTMFFFSQGARSAQEKAKEYTITKTYTLEINSSINPATLDYIKQGLAQVERPKETLFLIKINTPGGLVTTTKDIITAFGKQDSVVAIWVTPEGASATSAGAIIASSAHFLFMSPGTNIGAATPVGLGKDIEGQKPLIPPTDKKPSEKSDKESGKKKSGGDMRAKAINDLVALTSSLSQARGRNAKAFGKMISEAASYNAQEALKKNIINGIAHHTQDIYDFIENKEVTVLGEKRVLKVSPSVQTEKIEMSIGQSILNIFSNPSTAYILFMVGAALLYLEFQAPGGLIAGSIGAVCLLLAAIGFQVLPINYGGLGLIVVAFILFIMEVYITSYGILSLAAVASLVFGSLMLYRTENAYLQIQTGLILSVIGGILFFGAMIILVILNDRKKFKPTHFFTPAKQKGKILGLLEQQSDGSYLYQVRVAGEIWKTESNEKFNKGDFVNIDEVDNDRMSISISKIQGES